VISLKQKELIISNNIKEADLITHSGTFHSDDIFSTVILKNILDKECIKICRINDIEEEIDSIVYDIGGGKYDHHQPGGNGERENGIKYSSFGLIWKDFGKVFLEKIGVENISQVWEKIDKKIVQTIDATDNGQFSIINKFDFEIVTIPNLISVYNSNWDEEEKQDIFFLQAVEFAENILIKIIIDEDSKEKAKILIETAIEESENQIIILEKFLPWKECLLQSTNPKAKDILFVIFPSNREGYNICTVPKELGSFESKKLFPIEWKGLRDEELQKITGVNTAFFCHNERFICCTRTKDDALKIAELAINS
jgi:uncharacterized UPF0160 family protein